MREAKEAEVGRREVLLVRGDWAVVRVPDRARKRGRYRCILIQFEASEILVVDTMVS